MIIFDPDHPLVLDGTYDIEGYKPGERARIAKARVRSQQLENGAPMAKKKADAKTKPRQQDLIADRAIKPLEDIAESYADVRDRRMELNKEEAELKAHALKLMHKYEKTIYRSNGVEIRVIEGAEDVKVRIKKPGDEETDGDTAEIGDAESAEA